MRISDWSSDVCSSDLTAVETLGVARIDHGVRSNDDPAVLQLLIDRKIPLTVCPLSNLKLKVVDDLASHNLAKLLRQGALVTINSDDPAYFGGDRKSTRLKSSH